ncbi:ELO family [Baffinella frigidus]|nr:ELO family [Cryptophyta sp. CCMP2293]
MVASAVIYYGLVKLVMPATRPTSEASRKRLGAVRDAHNLFLFVFSAVCCISTAFWLYSEGQLFSWSKLMCVPVEGTWLRLLSVVFLLSKIWEWGDTAFLIWLGSRPPEFLHLYHHATTTWLFCMVVNLPGPEKFGLLLNGGVHMLMYSHYWRAWPKVKG